MEIQMIYSVLIAVLLATTGCFAPTTYYALTGRSSLAQASLATPISTTTTLPELIVLSASYDTTDIKTLLQNHITTNKKINLPAGAIKTTLGGSINGTSGSITVYIITPTGNPISLTSKELYGLHFDPAITGTQLLYASFSANTSNGLPCRDVYNDVLKKLSKRTTDYAITYCGSITGERMGPDFTDNSDLSSGNTKTLYFSLYCSQFPQNPKTYAQEQTISMLESGNYYYYWCKRSNGTSALYSITKASYSSKNVNLLDALYKHIISSSMLTINLGANGSGVPQIYTLNNSIDPVPNEDKAMTIQMSINNGTSFSITGKDTRGLRFDLFNPGNQLIYGLYGVTNSTVMDIRPSLQNLLNNNSPYTFASYGMNTYFGKDPLPGTPKNLYYSRFLAASLTQQSEQTIVESSGGSVTW